MHGSQHLPHSGILRKCFIFRSRKLALFTAFTVSEKPQNQMKGKEHSVQALATRLKQSNRSKGIEMELRIKIFEGKEKKKCSIGGID